MLTSVFLVYIITYKLHKMRQMKSVEEFMVDEGLESQAELGRLVGVDRFTVHRRAKGGWLVGWRVLDGVDLIGWENDYGQTVFDGRDI